ncbi:MAG: cell division protein FtsI (penicillin-binding protein 3) [Parcubacteria group bacterium Gr01-1014_20]|nr:MAG: cell division protein FtsI (penicillin-binding protein 3) [Parcubacteria group bacterium Gr01-1014_20]
MGIRFTIIIVGFSLVFAFLIFNVYNLQVVNGGKFTAKADSQYFSSVESKANRGSIYFLDKNSNTLPAVLNKEFPVVFAVPKAIDDPRETASLLSEIIGENPAALEEKFSKTGDPYELILKKAETSIVEKISELKIPGIHIDTGPERFYPFGSLGAQVLGFVGPSDSDDVESGRYGLEKFYNDLLAGKNGRKEDGRLVTLPEAGGNLTLTIDPNIQKEAQKILSGLTTTFKAKGGSVIVQEPKTGKILALESSPSFDPNNYGQASISSFLNPSIQTIYEPGSVFKVITMAAGIDAGKFSPETTYFDTGSLTVSGKKIKNWDLKHYGKVTMTNVIEKSINTGAAYAESLIGRDVFKKYLESFGFGEKTGIDLPGEVSGDLRALNSKSPEVAFATASFGQGVAVTTAEMINAISAIANGGNLMRPYLNSESEPKIIRRVISARTAREVTEMMVSALEKAEIGQIKSYKLAGKTGTAQVPDFTKGGYTDKVINTYVGFGPVADPKFVILIRLNEPENAPLAGTTVVPAFRELAQFILNYYNLSPDGI